MRRDACWSRNCADSYPASFSRCPSRPLSARASLLARPSKRYARMYSPNVMEATLHVSASYLRNRKRVKSASRWWAMWRFRRKHLWRYYRLGNEFMRNAENWLSEESSRAWKLASPGPLCFFLHNSVARSTELYYIQRGIHYNYRYAPSNSSAYP